MGERKGTNHYYPPDYDPKKGGLNKFLGTHALRERAKKIHLGILIIRFEMPYNIWCDGCGNHIGMGVRYNAEKTKIGMYYSTPVYQFRMKCHLCDNHFEIKTDPGNLDYVIVSGARRQENRWDPTQNEQVVPETKETSRKLYDDAMFKLEHTEGDHDKAKKIKPALEKLAYHRERKWKDDYSANCLLRTNFRIRERELKRTEESDMALLKRASLDIPLLPETEEDKKMASLLALTPAKSINERKEQSREKIFNRPALPSYSKRSSTSLQQRLSKHLSLPSFQRDELVTSLSTKANILNTRSETITSKSPNNSNLISSNESIKKEDEININLPSDSKSLNGLINKQEANASKITLVSNEYESSTDSEDN